MTIPALPALDRTSPTFKTDVDTFFATQLPSFAAALDPEIERLNAVGYGSYNASSTTSLTIGTGSKSLTIETGKGYVAGQAVLIASTAGPTNYMAGQVTSYTSGTGALVVNVTATGGSGTFAAWTISVTAVVSAGGVSPDSIVTLTSGTSWTCPAGVTKVRGICVGGCGGGGWGNGSISGGSGGGGGASVFVAPVTPGASYTYSIGAGGSAAGSAGGSGGGGGTTTMTINGESFTGSGGSGGTGSSPYLGGDGGSGSVGGTSRGFVVVGTPGETGSGNGFYTLQAPAAFGPGLSGNGMPSSAVAGSAGRIILELYK